MKKEELQLNNADVMWINKWIKIISTKLMKDSGVIIFDTTDIPDMPTTLTAQAGKLLKVNSTSTAYELGYPAKQTITLVAGATLSANKAVTTNASGQAIYADKDTSGDFLGLTMTSATSGTNVEVQKSGEFTNNTWAWDNTKLIWLSTSGELTQTPPTTGYSLIIGKPITATKINITKEIYFIL